MSSLTQLIQEAERCRLCEAALPEGPRPVFRAHSNARILVIGQAPGRRVHASAIPWDDPSGERLRRWMALDKTRFYSDRLAILPMGFCYPGTGTSGDLPPRPECAPQWHLPLIAHMPHIELSLFIGQYAQRHYLDQRAKNLTETVRQYEQWLENGTIALPHPSPRNNRWLSKNPWFEEAVLPRLQQAVQAAFEK
ncbi:1-(5-Phosphoribosyl)-5-amino-4-imidazole- carboxylate (AIR) carboxylase [gamma proteobacterium HTCC5015]|nr:1-(5-Phosphoribosyl)-5-amino-4-imidazole- carboxylate (AIR) carboxylase [gamma proteobacterium HTCC5015]